jgi:hypothetical protein
MNSPKPILVIRMPKELADSYRRELVEQLLELKGRLDDYHLIPLFESGLSRTEFECYNPPKSKLNSAILTDIENKVDDMLNKLK